MSDHALLELLRCAGGHRYRKLVQQHLRSGTASVGVGILAEMTQLPDQVASYSVQFLASLDRRFGDDRSFWKSATIREAFDQIVAIALVECPMQGMIASPRDATELRNCDLAFALFQMATLNFAYAAGTDERRRRLMGVTQRASGRWARK